MKKITILFSIFITGFLIWYLFIKSYDYLVTFKINTSTGTVNQSLKKWNVSLKNLNIIEQENLNNLTQRFNFNDSTHIYKWNTRFLNDTVSEVKVYVSDLNYSFQNKISIPFSNTDFEKRTKKTVTNFVDELKNHLKKFKVNITGESTTKATYCAYVSIKGLQVEKALGMMKNYSFLNSILANNQVALNGKPFIEITKWDIDKDSIAYDFCYPIIKSDFLPTHQDLKYKQVEPKKALKAIYNGNYITSDRAWYALIDYAKMNAIEIQNKPIEVFHTNPNMGGGEMNWKAEIFMPIE